MVRKQLYISEDQNRSLKARAKELGISEAELARRALDNMLHSSQHSLPTGRRKALDQLLASTQRIAENHRLPKGFRFDRSELYAEREARWTKK